MDQEQKLLMSGSWDANAIVWPIDQVTSGGEFNALGLVGHTLSVWAVSTVPNMPDHYLTGSADKAVKFWHHDKELRSFLGRSSFINNVLITILGHTDVVRSILVVSSSNFFTSSNDSTIRLWDLMTGECVAKYMSLSGDYLYRLVLGLSSLNFDEHFDLVCAALDQARRCWRLVVKAAYWSCGRLIRKPFDSPRSSRSVCPLRVCGLSPD